MRVSSFSMILRVIMFKAPGDLVARNVLVDMEIVFRISSFRVMH